MIGLKLNFFVLYACESIATQFPADINVYITLSPRMNTFPYLFYAQTLAKI